MGSSRLCLALNVQGPQPLLWVWVSSPVSDTVKASQPLPSLRSLGLWISHPGWVGAGVGQLSPLEGSEFLAQSWTRRPGTWAFPAALRAAVAAVAGGLSASMKLRGRSRSPPGPGAHSPVPRSTEAPWDLWGRRPPSNCTRSVSPGASAARPTPLQIPDHSDSFMYPLTQVLWDRALGSSQKSKFWFRASGGGCGGCGWSSLLSLPS